MTAAALDIPVGQLLARGARCRKDGELWRAFLRFHRDHPWVYDRLKELCQRLRRRGFRRYSTRTLIAVLRFEFDLRTDGEKVRIGGAERTIKLNDHHTAYYARLLIEECPEFGDFFELRRADGDPVDELDGRETPQQMVMF